MNEEKMLVELTGNAFIDAYNLGYQAAKNEAEIEKQRSSDRYWEQYREAVAAKDRCKELEAEIGKLKAKVKKLKKRNAKGE